MVKTSSFSLCLLADHKPTLKSTYNKLPYLILKVLSYTSLWQPLLWLLGVSRPWQHIKHTPSPTGWKPHLPPAVAADKYSRSSCVSYSVTWLSFHGQQDVRGGDCRVWRLSNTEQSGDSIGLQLLSSSWRPRYLLKLALFKMILWQTRQGEDIHVIHLIIQIQANTRNNKHAYNERKSKGKSTEG